MELNKIFTSHMVFAGGEPIRIYGTGKGTVKVNLAGYEKELTSENDTWMLELEPMEYGGPYVLEAVFEDRTVALEDIYIGKVYLFSGQSNMAFKMRDSSTPEGLWRGNDKLRLFTADDVLKTDKYTSDDGWIVCEKDDIVNWSAIAYLTSDAVSEECDVAVGVIVCYRGASVIESWVPKGTFENIGIKLSDEDKFCDHFIENYSAWNGDGVLYECGLSKIIPFALSAVIWYQGESDASVGEGRVYCRELCALIDVWRKDFMNDSLSFVVIKIADTGGRVSEGWSLVQKAQDEISTKMSNVYTVQSGDVCETDDIHPKTKYKLSERIANVLIKL